MIKSQGYCPSYTLYKMIKKKRKGAVPVTNILTFSHKRVACQPDQYVTDDAHIYLVEIIVVVFF